MDHPVGPGLSENPLQSARSQQIGRDYLISLSPDWMAVHHPEDRVVPGGFQGKV
jgi:hypothetical protein